MSKQKNVEVDGIIWYATGGGFYENIEGDRVRGKKNIPGYNDPAITGSLLIDPVSAESRIMCSVCNSVTLHIGRACRVCGEVNA